MGRDWSWCIFCFYFDRYGLRENLFDILKVPTWKRVNKLTSKQLQIFFRRSRLTFTLQPPWKCSATLDRPIAWKRLVITDSEASQVLEECWCFYLVISCMLESKRHLFSDKPTVTTLTVTTSVAHFGRCAIDLVSVFHVKSGWKDPGACCLSGWGYSCSFCSCLGQNKRCRMNDLCEALAVSHDAVWSISWELCTLLQFLYVSGVSCPVCFQSAQLDKPVSEKEQSSNSPSWQRRCRHLWNRYKGDSAV